MSSSDKKIYSHKNYIEKAVFNDILKKLLLKIKHLETKVDKLERDNGSIDSLYRKMDQLLIQMRKSYHFGKEDDYDYESE
jgi:site-specific DNA-adenine methylase